MLQEQLAFQRLILTTNTPESIKQNVNISNAGRNIQERAHNLALRAVLLFAILFGFHFWWGHSFGGLVIELW